MTDQLTSSELFLISSNLFTPHKIIAYVVVVVVVAVIAFFWMRSRRSQAR